MKIKLPGSGKNQNGNQKKSKKNKKVDRPTTSGWRDNGDNLTAIICGKLVKIVKETNEIQFTNGFVMRCKNLEEAKLKANEFYGIKGS